MFRRGGKKKDSGGVPDFQPFIADPNFTDPSQYAEFGFSVNLYEKYQVYSTAYDIKCIFEITETATAITAGQTCLFAEKIGEVENVYSSTGFCTFTAGSRNRWVAVYGSFANYEIPDGAIWGYALTDITSILENLTLVSLFHANSIVTIGDDIFRGCRNLGSLLTIPQEVTYIGNNAFRFLENNLTHVIIHENVTYIGNGAFSADSSLEAITCNAVIPPTLGIDTFLGAAEFRLNVPIGSEGAYQSWGVGLNRILTPINNVVIIPDNVTYIADNSFRESRELTLIQITNNITSIGNYAFYYCENITELNLFDSVTSIGSSAFSWCTKLESIYIPEGLTVIKDASFYRCSSLATVSLPSTTVEIETNAFRFCSALQTFTCSAINPPLLGSEVFKYAPNDWQLHVPTGSEQAYATAWDIALNRIYPII